MGRFWDGNLIKQNRIMDALEVDFARKCLVCVVGGGGKTSLLYRLGAEAVKSGKKVILTTTTHMWKPKAISLVLNCEEQRTREILDREGMVLIGRQDPVNPAKICGVSEAELEKFRNWADVVLVEADGARGLPLKAPANWEPVIPEACDLVIGVAGADCMGRPLREACFRPELAAGLLGIEAERPVTCELLAELLCHPSGTRKEVSCDYRIFFNKVDGPAEFKTAQKLQGLLKARGEQAAFGALKERVAVILLGAGNSRRFQGNKLLYPLEGIPMYRRIVEHALKLPADQRIMITQYQEILKDLEGSLITAVQNPHPEWGISHSIRLGIETAGDVDAYLFAVCDQPFLQYETLECLLERFITSGKGIAAVSGNGHLGNPNIFSACYREELRALTGDVGGKAVMKRHLEDVAIWEIKGEEELRDIDDRSQLSALGFGRKVEKLLDK